MYYKPNSINSEFSQLLPLLVILFAGSGCAALIYEVIWLQMLQLVVGLTTVSLGVLLGTYMGGMCLGSLLLPRIISIKYHPLRVYAILELGIGILGLMILFGMPLLQNIYTGIAGYGLFRSVLLRAVIAAFCLLPPTILMGATLPAISRWVETTPRGVSWMGFFYGGNIFGAVAGCFLTGFYLLRVFNTVTATCVALCLNLFVSLSAILISLVTSYNYDRPAEKYAGQSAFKLKVVHITIALSGMAALGSEVIWTRLLSIILGSTVYTFSIILGAFLAGLGIGSGAGAFLSRNIKCPGFALGMCQFFLILAIAWASYIITQSLPYWSMDLTTISNQWHLFRYDLAFSILAVTPPAIFWGASFPLALAAVVSQGKDPGRLVGGVYASNTIGAIAGSLSFSLIGIPVLGSAVSQKLLVVISAMAAILMFFQALSEYKYLSNLSIKKILSFRNILFSGVTAGIALLTVIVISNIKTIPWGAVAYGRNMCNYNTSPELNETTREQPGETITPIYIGEGLNGSVAVTSLNNGVIQFHSIGKVQASTDPLDMRLQRMLGHITGLLTENPESVLVVGCGAGITAGTFITYPEVRNIVVCEIESLVPKFVAPLFSKENYGIADGIGKENPHTVNGKEVQFENDDGRHYIQTTRKKFDIISSDPIDPWAKGAAALYTLEYFKMCKAHLKPGGSVSFWMPLYQSSTESVKSMISTFFTVFPNGIIWSNDNNGSGYDMVLFGQAESIHIDIEKLEKKFYSKDYTMVRESLAEVEFHCPEDLLSTYAGRAQDLHKWMADAQINTDRNLRLSYLSGMSVNFYQATEILFGIFKSYEFPKNLFSGSDQSIESIRHNIDYKMLLIEEEQNQSFSDQ
jgi:spermidine synthase